MKNVQQAARELALAMMKGQGVSSSVAELVAARKRAEGAPLCPK